MKKAFALSLCVIMILTFTLVACSKNDDDGEPTTAPKSTAQVSDLDNSGDEYGVETETVTNDRGKAVTDKKGKTYAQKIDKNGNAVTKKSGKPVTAKIESTVATTAKSTSTKKFTTDNTTKAPKLTGTTNKKAELTKTADTTKFDKSETVPKISATGEEVNFSKSDMQIVANMLEVPYLYLENYENSDGVPIKIAAYTAVWMAQHDGGTADTYPSSPVVLNLFKFYGQTVVNFKTQVEKFSNVPIKYNKKNDTFTVKEYPKKKQTVKITKIEDLGDNNFYKVTGKVSGAGDVKHVEAVIQKNKLDSTLGFSIKALNWSK